MHMRRLCVLFFLAVCIPLSLRAETLEERRARLQQQLASIESDIDQKRGVLSQKQSERKSLERDISILTNKIDIAKSQIKARDIALSKIADDISEKESAIADVDDRITINESSLAELLRRTRELDDRSLVAVALSESVSAVFEDVDRYEAIRSALRDSFEKLNGLRSDLSMRKAVLEDKKGEEEELKRAQVVEKQAIERREKEKKTILTETKGQEKAYQKIIADQEKQAAAIRAALFDLRDSSAISFGTALKYAQEASAITGVRPALILGILREETNLGQNIGKGNWRVDMKSPRDTEPFTLICAELGLDPDKMPVSKKPSYGWGGAMGPAQFIPSTWILYKKRIAEVTGQNPPNPWDARTAIFATALLMKDNGAAAGDRASERLAALRYLAGWNNANKRAYAFYGDDVMEFADEYQKQIDILGG